MEIQIDGINYNINIIRKDNKRTYIRLKDDFTIQVTTHHLVTNKEIIKLIQNNLSSIKKMINAKNKQTEKQEEFYFLGQKYDIIELSIQDNIEFDNDKIYIKNQTQLNKWLKTKIKEIFTYQFNLAISKFNQKIKKPELKLRNMKSRWGVYNRKNHSVTLNTNLIRYNEEVIEYVIIHELSHIIHFDHSSSFWHLVEQNIPNYKQIKKQLKE